MFFFLDHSHILTYFFMSLPSKECFFFLAFVSHNICGGGVLLLHFPSDFFTSLNLMLHIIHMISIPIGEGILPLMLLIYSKHPVTLQINIFKGNYPQNLKV